MAETLEVRVREGDLFCQPEEWVTMRSLATGETWLQKAQIPNGYLLRFPTLAEFMVTADGCQIDYLSNSGTPDDTLRHLLLDHVLPLTLNLRGIEALHATAVLTSAGVCVFTGSSGVGKSTLAAYLARAGMKVLCDDCLVLQESHGQLLAVPAYPGVRLWGDALALIKKPAVASIPVAHYTEKRRLLTDRRQDKFSLAARPITRLYSLVRQQTAREAQEEDSPWIERLSPRDGCVELLPHLYRFDFIDRDTFVQQLAFLERLVSRIQVRRLHCPNSFSALPAIKRTLCADFNRRKTLFVK